MHASVKVTMDEAIFRYLMLLVADGRSEHTRKQYARHLNRFADWLVQAREKYLLESIDNADVSAFFGSASTNTNTRGGWKKATSMNAMRSSIRTFFGFVHHAGWIPWNPTDLLRRAICGAGSPRLIAPEDVDRLFATIGADPSLVARRDWMLVLVMLKTGARVSEALGIDVPDVDLRRREIRLRMAKGNQPATVPFAEGLASELAAWIGDRTAGPVFEGRPGTRMTTRHAQRRFGVWVREAGLPIGTSPHALRHTFATRLYERTGDLLVVQAACRHRAISSSVVYARASDTRVRSAFQY